MNKNILKIITLAGLIYGIMKTGIEIYFLLVGGVIIWASPFIPMYEWGEVLLFPNIIVFFTLILAVYYIIQTIKNSE